MSQEESIWYKHIVQNDVARNCIPVDFVQYFVTHWIIQPFSEQANTNTILDVKIQY